jgi:hypothetical protein
LNVNKMVDRSKTGPENCPENDHWKTGRSGIRSFTVTDKFLSTKFSD